MKQIQVLLKQNFTLVLAFIIPIIFILVLALVTYLPRAFFSVKYDFIYAACTDGPYYNCNRYLQQRYSVVEGKLVVNAIDSSQDSDANGVSDVNENYQARIFLHNTEQNQSKEISLEEAQALDVSNLLTSPDGVSLTENYDQYPSPFFLFDTGSAYGYYLSKRNSKLKLKLIRSDDPYYHRENFRFIGWVLPGRN